MGDELVDRFAPSVVRASAGTGKTFVLTSRYLSLLFTGETPDRILATTFTRKAAGEIWLRVIERLASALRSDTALRELAEQLKIELSVERVRYVLRDLLAAQHRIRICTLDAFCVQIATCFGLELGLAPQWVVCDPEQEQEMRREAVRQVLSHSDVNDLAELVRDLSELEWVRSVQRRLELNLRELYELWRGSESEAWHWIPAQTRAQDSRVLEELQASLCELKLPTTKKGTVDKRWERAVADSARCLVDGDLQGLLVSGIPKKILAGESEFASHSIDGQLRSVYDQIIGYISTSLLEQLRTKTEASAAFLALFDQKLLELKESVQQYSFMDLKCRLTDHELVQDLEYLYFRLDSKIRHVLLDEFQDTSLLEWRVLQPIVDEALAHADGEHSFFCVGDTKQAIYAWRGGVAEIFDSLECRWPQLEVTTADKSFRCAPAILQAVNSIFAALPSTTIVKNFPAIAEQWQQRFIAHTAADVDQSGRVELHALQRQLIDTEEDLFEQVVEDLLWQIEANPEQTVGVLFRTNERLALFAALMRARAPNMTISQEGGLRLSDSVEVELVLALLRMIEHPSDSCAVYHVAHSCLAEEIGLADWRNSADIANCCARLRADLQTHGLSIMLTRWVSMIKAALGIRSHRQLEQLCILGSECNWSAATRVTEFRRLVEKRRIEDVTVAQVRLMTVYKAKGLEFDVVYLPDLEHDLTRIREPLLYFSQAPLEPPVRIARFANKNVRALEPALAEMHQQMQERRLNESLCLLYVALTRARHRLSLWCRQPRPSGRDRTYAALVMSALGIEISDVDIHSVVAENQGASMQTTPTIERSKQQVKLLSGTSVSRRRLVRKTPSQLEGGGSVALDKRLKHSSGAARRAGVVLHSFFESIEWLHETLPIQDQVRTILDALDWCGEAYSELNAECVACLKHPQVRSIFEPTSYAQREHDRLEVWREQRFVVREGETLYTGVFDRVVIASLGDHVVWAEVLDYKTDRPHAGLAHDDLDTWLAEKNEYYCPQLEVYRRAAAARCSLSPEAVTAKLVFVRLGEVIDCL